MHLALKIFGELILPPFSLALLALTGVLLLARHPRLARALITAPLILLLLLALPLWGYLLGGTSHHYPYTAPPWPKADALVILGGGRRPYAVEYGIPETASGSTLERLRYGAKLAREYHLPILVSGGKPHLGTSRGHMTEGDLMREILESEYHLPVRWVENRADDTLQNAQYSAPLLRADGIQSIWLVTNSWHAERAKRAFEAQGLTVTPTPTNFPPPRRLSANDFIPSFNGLNVSRSLLYDWLNRLRG